jgi:esterase/lipase superfamily enzyme
MMSLSRIYFTAAVLCCLGLAPASTPALAEQAVPAQKAALAQQTGPGQQEPAPSSPPSSPLVTYVAPQNYSQLWVDKSAVVTDKEVAATIAGLRKQVADPEHIVVFLHGFNVARDSSTAKFDRLAARLKETLGPNHGKVAFAGIQWESASDSSIFELANVYWEKISVARSVGRGPTRQLLLEIKKAFPKAHISLMAHSMGCEVTEAAIVPELDYEDQIPFVPTYQPETPLSLNLVTLCGSDLDYDIWSKSKADPKAQNQRVRLTWQTVAPYDKNKKRDKVLSYRARLRGKAGGSAFPLMTLPQLDEVVSTRRILLDTSGVPSDHDFDKYYDEARLAKLVPSMLYLANPKLAKPPELAELDGILALPNDVTTLLPYLDSPNVGSFLYTLWRLERLNCGDARHLTDGTLEAIGRMLVDKPQMIWREAPKSDCATIRSEQFPTVKAMTRAGAPPRARKK